MNKAMNLLKKTVKVAGVVCVATGAVALLTSGTAAVAVAEGINYAKGAIKKIVNQETEEAIGVAEEAAEAETAESEAEPVTE